MSKLIDLSHHPRFLRKRAEIAVGRMKQLREELWTAKPLPVPYGSDGPQSHLLGAQYPATWHGAAARAVKTVGMWGLSLAETEIVKIVLGKKHCAKDDDPDGAA